MTITIGKIVKSNTHVDYVCQIYGPGESDVLPQPGDYSFGTFVSIRLEGQAAPGERLVGVIYNTLLMNPDFGNLGPRLSPRQELEVFTPDYLAETATLVGIIALGWIDSGGRPWQGVPAVAATVNTPVHRLEDDELCLFHQGDQGRLNLRYVPMLLGQNSPLVPQLLLQIVDRLARLFPQERSRLAVMRNNLAWKNIVQPAG
ncbi:hypothetical protein FKZ61_014355 [Litorilinea aerophila]|uniref:DUF8166 domain-containing protein n=1 Tax=Litorilinea aerophila TaxID=1204385 RepID=A0A540VDY4_9CHLR|nr:hypothetical protein [Litorilinea aerophila]MCC9077284.1 hypothetical protein [Litorilinea aerophila]